MCVCVYIYIYMYMYIYISPPPPHTQVGGSFDDYVPPKDAYVHNLLTSSAPGIDHFGHLAPLSKV